MPEHYSKKLKRQLAQAHADIRTLVNNPESLAAYQVRCRIRMKDAAEHSVWFGDFNNKPDRFDGLLNLHAPNKV